MQEVLLFPRGSVGQLMLTVVRLRGGEDLTLTCSKILVNSMRLSSTFLVWPEPSMGQFSPHVIPHHRTPLGGMLTSKDETLDIAAPSLPPQKKFEAKQRYITSLSNTICILRKRKVWEENLLRTTPVAVPFHNSGIPVAVEEGAPIERFLDPGSAAVPVLPPQDVPEVQEVSEGEVIKEDPEEVLEEVPEEDLGEVQQVQLEESPVSSSPDEFFNFN